MTLDPNTVVVLAPTAKLRAAINLGNPILARRADPGADPVGVSVDLARGFAERLGVELRLVVFETAARAVEAVESDQADIGFFAIDPTRGVHIAFTDAYLVIEGAYLVRQESPIVRNEEVDLPGRRVVVGRGSAYDLHLSRALHHAAIERATSSQAVVDAFLTGGADVAAGVRQQLDADAARVGGLRLLDGRFMEIRQAMAVPRTRGPAAAALLTEYVEDMKASGFVAEALRRHRIDGASVAPAAG